MEFANDFEKNVKREVFSAEFSELKILPDWHEEFLIWIISLLIWKQNLSINLAQFGKSQCSTIRRISVFQKLGICANP